MKPISLFAVGHAVAGATAVKQPCILLLTTDQQRLDTMGCYGSTFAQSPNIDRLAQQGVRYKESYTASPVCTSARTSWLTGTQVPVHNTWGNGMNSRLELNPGNIIDPLKEAGYFTAAIGKTHYEPVPNYDYLDAHSGNTDRRMPNTPAAEFLETYLVNQTMKLLDNQLDKTIPGDQPWFIHLSFVSPHPPSNVPLEWQNMYRNVSLPKVHYGGLAEIAAYPRQLKGLYGDFKGSDFERAFPNGRANNTYIHEARREYYALANYVDHQIGRILDFLDRRGLADSTHVIFTSDHGTNLYDHGLLGKYNFFQESWKVPLILRGPGLPKGVTQEFAAGVDVSATILAIAQAKRPAGLNGFDLAGPLQQGRQSMRTHGVVGALLEGYGVATCAWKFSYYLDDRQGQLFDRVNDPDEMVNLFDDPEHVAEKAQLLLALLQWRSRLNPVEWLQGHHAASGEFTNTKFVLEYTNNLSGTEPEIQLQADLAGLQCRSEQEHVV